MQSISYELGIPYDDIIEMKVKFYCCNLSIQFLSILDCSEFILFFL